MLLSFLRKGEKLLEESHLKPFPRPQQYRNQTMVSMVMVKHIFGLYLHPFCGNSSSLRFFQTSSVSLPWAGYSVPVASRRSRSLLFPSVVLPLLLPPKVPAVQVAHARLPTPPGCPSQLASCPAPSTGSPLQPSCLGLCAAQVI